MSLVLPFLRQGQLLDISLFSNFFEGDKVELTFGIDRALKLKSVKTNKYLAGVRKHRSSKILFNLRDRLSLFAR